MQRSVRPLALKCRCLMANQSTRALSTSAETTEVVFVDPRLVLTGANEELLENSKAFTILKLPTEFLEHLSKGMMELGELDDPLNTWYFGQRDEIFTYRLMGTHPTMSGFTSVIEQQELQSICSGDNAAGLPEWEDFKADLQAGTLSFPSIRSPFLFAGTVLDSPAAAVYQLKKNGEVVGLAISSEAAEAG